MSSRAAKVAFRLAMAALLVIVLFYVGRPIYWKISATVHDIRENKRTVSQGISQLVWEAQNFGGWFSDEAAATVAAKQDPTEKKKTVPSSKAQAN